jgi:dihydrofolate reductase
MSIAKKVFPIVSVVAVTPSWGIGMKGTLPWMFENIVLPGDMAHFKHITSKTEDSSKMNAVIMGRKTWNSIPEKFQPLSGRVNIIISQTLDSASVSQHLNTFVVPSFNRALELLLSDSNLNSLVERAMVIGGVGLFEESVLHPWFESLHITYIARDFACDAFLTERTVQYIQQDMVEVSATSGEVEENGVTYRSDCALLITFNHFNQFVYRMVEYRRK